MKTNMIDIKNVKFHKETSNVAWSITYIGLLSCALYLLDKSL